MLDKKSVVKRNTQIQVKFGGTLEAYKRQSRTQASLTQIKAELSLPTG